MQEGGAARKAGDSSGVSRAGRLPYLLRFQIKLSRDRCCVSDPIASFRKAGGFRNTRNKQDNADDLLSKGCFFRVSFKLSLEPSVVQMFVFPENPSQLSDDARKGPAPPGCSVRTPPRPDCSVPA